MLYLNNTVHLAEHLIFFSSLRKLDCCAKCNKYLQIKEVWEHQLFD